jgi:hypothetical protein
VLALHPLFFGSPGDARTMRTEDLLLDTAHRRPLHQPRPPSDRRNLHSSAKRNLARDGRGGWHGSPREQADKSQNHPDSSTRSVFLHCPGREVQLRLAPVLRTV